MPDTPDRFLTVADIAERLAADSTYVLALINSGALLAINIALPGASKRRLRIPTAELQRFLLARQVGGPKPRQKHRRRKTETTEVCFY